MYHLLTRQTTYQALGADYFHRRHAERVKRRAVEVLERQGYRVNPCPEREIESAGRVFLSKVASWVGAWVRKVRVAQFQGTARYCPGDKLPSGATCAIAIPPASGFRRPLPRSAPRFTRIES